MLPLNTLDNSRYSNPFSSVMKLAKLAFSVRDYPIIRVLVNSMCISGTPESLRSFYYHSMISIPFAVVLLPWLLVMASMALVTRGF
jgi:hypothetical protein